MCSKIVVILSIVLLSACSHFKHHHDSHEQHSSSTVKSDKLDLSLNGDSKWMMDAHTRSAILDMTNRLSSVALEQQSKEQLVNLGNSLSQDLDNLIQGCTMQGNAHNALHDFLTNFIPALEKLKKTGSIDSAKYIEHLLSEYQQYFE